MSTFSIEKERFTYTNTMKHYSSQELRNAWDMFWKEKNHKYLPEASLVGWKSSTAMFTIAGMQQLIPYLAGKPHELGKRLYNIQKCIRTVDIDEVGDASHLTFFHMMGNRSLWDYFKKEAVKRSWEFLVDVLWFDPKKLAVTVFEGDKETPKDEETAGYWKAAWMEEDRIAYMPAENNRWSPGPIGPCWPDTEIFYWVGKKDVPPAWSNPKTDEDNWLEIWNNVFMEFYRDEKGILTKLENQNVDTGMWLERMIKVLQEKETVFETDQFSSLLALIEKYTHKSYAENIRRMRIIVDHTRTAFFLLKEGITPSNEGRWYVLRRLIRRMYYNIVLIKSFSAEEIHNFLGEVGEELAHLFSDQEIKKSVWGIEKEIIQFQKTITNGEKLLKEICKLHADTKLLPGKEVFKLYDTCWFPIELTKEVVWEMWYAIDYAWFEKEMQLQQKRSREWSKDMFKVGIDRSTYVAGIQPTIFTGYKGLEEENMELIKDFEVEWKRVLIFKSTPFYAESGWQTSDTWVIILDSWEQLTIKEVRKYEGVVLHIVE